MKTEFKTVEKRVPVYIAGDGKEFDNAADCEKWEQSYKYTLNLGWKSLPKIAVNTMYAGLEYNNECNECWLIKPRDLNDVTLINAYAAMRTGELSDIKPAHIGKNILLDFGYECCYAYVIDANEHVKQIENYIKSLITELEGINNESIN